MKKSFLIVVVCLVLGMRSATAQIGYGIKAGLNISSVKFNASYEGDFNSITGFYVGPFANVPLIDRFSIQPELLLSRQGYSYDHPFLNHDPKFENLYLNVPVMLLCTVIEKLRLEAGPQIGFLVHSTSKLGDESEDSKELFMPTDIGINLGVNYQLPMGILVGLRYNFGLANISEDTDDGVESVKNRVFSVGIGYVIK